MLGGLLKLSSCLWCYLNQPLFCADTRLHPRKFFRHYQQAVLEKSLNKVVPVEAQRDHLERCWDKNEVR